MIELIATTFVASLIGSLHCAGMCGAFVAIATMPTPGEGRPVPRGVVNAAYNLGRLMTYTLLGGLAGLLGSAINLGGTLAGIERASAILAGGILACVGVLMLLKGAGVRLGRVPLPAFWVRWVSKGHGLALRVPPMPRALLIGLLTTLLPCGWLYAFAINAAGTGDPVRGALTMTAFWFGTLPMMAALGAGIRGLAGGLGARMPIAAGIALVIVGFSAVAGRLIVHSDHGPLTTRAAGVCNAR